jgi:hypothetical protein
VQAAGSAAKATKSKAAVTKKALMPVLCGPGMKTL